MNKVMSETKKVTSRNAQCLIPATEIDWVLWLISKRDDPTLKEVSCPFFQLFSSLTSYKRIVSVEIFILFE